MVASSGESEYLGSDGEEPMNLEENAQSTTPDIADTSAELLRRGLGRVIRFTAAWAAEADVCEAASKNLRFIRGFEGSPCDGGIIVANAFARTLPRNVTDRSFTALRQYQDSSTNVIVPIDVKSFTYSVLHHFGMTKTTSRSYKRLEAYIQLQEEQVEHCKFLFIVSITDPDYLAVVPISYLEGRFTTGRYASMGFGQTTPGMLLMNPLPPVLAPFVVHKDMLSEVVENIASNANDASIKLRNPLSGLEYAGASQAAAAPFHVLVGSHKGELKLRMKLWNVFRYQAITTQQQPEFTMRNPTYAPVTSDLCLRHASGVEIFIELKQEQVKIRTLSTGEQRLSHAVRGAGRGLGIFTYKAPWDYILTMLNDVEGYLIRKDDVPNPWWHQTGVKGWLTAEFSDHTFLSNRRILLDETPTQIVRRFQRIMQGNDGSLTSPPLKANLTVEDILRLARPCPASLLQGLNKQDEEDMDDDLTAVLDNDTEANQPPVIKAVGSRFLNEPMGERKRIFATPEQVGDAQLFRMLQDQCRKSCKGCMLDLGKFHPFGRMAMIRYNWTQQDMKNFDEKGKPPRWIGMLDSHVAMVTINAVWNKWEQDYAPIESNNSAVRLYMDGHPCLVVSTALPKEFGHHHRARWLLPSEILPKIRYGTVRNPTYRIPLLLERSLDIECLLCANVEKLHIDILKFLSGAVSVTIGFANVEFNPRPYLKTVRDFKLSADFNFERCRLGPSGTVRRSTGAVEDLLEGEEGAEAEEVEEDEEDDEMYD